MGRGHAMCLGRWHHTGSKWCHSSLGPTSLLRPSSPWVWSGHVPETTAICCPTTLNKFHLLCNCVQPPKGEWDLKAPAPSLPGCPG